jgi:hypothetical protein
MNSARKSGIKKNTPLKLLIIPGILAFARKIATENREKMKPQAVIGIDGSWEHRRNGSAHLLDMVDVGSGRVVNFEMVQKTTASGPGNYGGSSNGMECDEMEWKWRHRGGW